MSRKQGKSIARAFGVILLAGAIPIITTKLEERRIRDPKQIREEIDFEFPQSTKIINAEASIWSCADGDNYVWTIQSKETLVPWVESIARREEDGLYRVVKHLQDGREETSYIEILQNGYAAEISTFRP